MNKFILDTEVQDYISNHLNADVHTIAMGKSPFKTVSSRELSTQIISKKKAEKKLPTWYAHQNIYYPEPLSIEQTSSEKAAAYKAGLILNGELIDLTGGFGVDSFYFSKKVSTVTHCEINTGLSAIAAHNFKVLGADNIFCYDGDGMDYLKSEQNRFKTIYVDPARRSDAGKVFMLKDCTPNIVEHMDLLFSRANRILIKTSPLLDITAGLKELVHVSEVHIVSTKNECKELLFILDRTIVQPVKIVCIALNESNKQFTFSSGESGNAELTGSELSEYIYEPDVALLKSGAFSLIAERYQLKKLHDQSQLYASDEFKEEFPGRIFRVRTLLSAADLKKKKNIKANIIVRNYPEKAAYLAKKYKISPAGNGFLIFTQAVNSGLLIIDAEILQYY